MVPRCVKEESFSRDGIDCVTAESGAATLVTPAPIENTLDIDPASRLNGPLPIRDAAQGNEDEVSEGTERENGSHEQAHEEGQVRCLHENSSDPGVEVDYFRSVRRSWLFPPRAGGRR